MRAIVMVLVVAVLVLPASAELKIRELVVPPDQDSGGMRSNIPWAPDGSQWHTLYPVACTIETQTDHDDTNGDGFIDECENIQVDGVWEHIEWAGPTIYLWGVGGRDEPLIVEPVGEPGSRTEYHVVSPLYCALVELPATLQVCDIVTILEGEFQGEWHVEEIRDNIHTNGGSPVDPSTWGKIKSFFADLF